MNINITNIANGALVEQVDSEIKRVLANIMDPNTDFKKKRKITITLEFAPHEDRDISDVSFSTKSTIIPTKPISTRIVFEKDGNGEIAVEELSKGALKGQSQIDYETGEIKEPKTMSRVVNLK